MRHPAGVFVVLPAAQQNPGLFVFLLMNGGIILFFYSFSNLRTGSFHINPSPDRYSPNHIFSPALWTNPAFFASFTRIIFVQPYLFICLLDESRLLHSLYTGRFCPGRPLSLLFGRILPSLLPSRGSFLSRKASFSALWTNRVSFTAFTQAKTGRPPFLEELPAGFSHPDHFFGNGLRTLLTPVI